VLFVHKDFSTQPVGISTVWGVWLHWDSINFRAVAVNGYTASWLTAFFPLYPLLVRGVMYVTHDFLTAGLLVSNLSGLGLLIVLYRLVQEDFDAERHLAPFFISLYFPWLSSSLPPIVNRFSRYSFFSVSITCGMATGGWRCCSLVSPS